MLARRGIETGDRVALWLGNEPDFAPFYAARASLPGRGASDVRHDLERAMALDATEWRYGKLLADHLQRSPVIRD